MIWIWDVKERSDLSIKCKEVIWVWNVKERSELSMRCKDRSDLSLKCKERSASMKMRCQER